MKLPLPLDSYKLRSTSGVRHLINCFIEKAEEKGPVLLQRSPGITDWTTVGAGPLRGVWLASGKLYVVSGYALYSVTSAGVVSASLGTVPGSGRVIMSDNGIHLVIIVRGAGYVYGLLTGSFGQITDPDFRPAIDCVFADNYILFVEENSPRFFGSDLADATSYDALNFATAEGQPDVLKGIEFDHEQVLLFGGKHLETWYNNGGSGFPFIRDPNGVIEIGCRSRDSIVKADNSVFWEANDGTVRRLSGITPQRVSTHYIEQVIADWSDTSAFSYTQEGHVFYALTSHANARTLVLDLTTQRWHDRQSRDDSNVELGYWRAEHYAAFGNLHVVGDSQSNKLGLLSMTANTEWDSILRMSWTYPPIYTQGRRAIHRRFVLGADTGVGLSGGEDPQVMLQFSDDDGKTFDEISSKSLGVIGDYQERPEWWRLGSAGSKSRVYRNVVSDPVPVTIFDTQVDVEGGRL